MCLLIKVVSFPTLADFEKLLSNKTKVVSFYFRVVICGNVLDEVAITKLVKRYNPEILVCVDATQSIQHRAIDVQAAGIDFMVCSAHKILVQQG